MRFSVIVPVYNVESYLDQCVLSIINQDFADFELLLIDDGSTDKSGSMCDEYADSHKNVFSYHKENGGLSDIRNFGLEHAKGDYIIFIDSDDWIAEGSFKYFNDCLKTAPDVLETRFVEVYDDQFVYKDEHFDDFCVDMFTKERAVEWICKHSENSWPAQKRIVKRTFIEENKLRFLKGRLHEDIDWTSRLCYCAESYGVCSRPWYFHRMGRAGAITATMNVKRIIDVIDIACIHYNFLQATNDSLHRMVYERIMQSVYSSLNLVSKCTKDDRESVICYISGNKGIFTVAPKLSQKIFVFVMKVVGVRIAVSILSRFSPIT